MTAAALAAAAWAVAGVLDVHSDPTFIDRPCEPCHRGHGATATAMLRDGGDEGCLVCHDPRSEQTDRRRALGIAVSARPADIRSQLLRPSTHSATGCAACHNVHGIELIERPNPGFPVRGVAKRSPKRGFRLEHELCLSCHGDSSATEDDPRNIARLFAPRNLSSHPVLMPSSSSSPSLLPTLSRGSILNCTDCHASDRSEVLGPHGSFTPKLLVADYSTGDGQEESETTYGLCYRCHDRAVILGGDSFPYHQLHLRSALASCSTCHNPHGATDGRALVPFNDSSALAGITPSASGRLGFESSGPGSGACYLSCHGADHDPLGYGAGFDRKGRPLFRVPGELPVAPAARPQRPLDALPATAQPPTAVER